MTLFQLGGSPLHWMGRVIRWFKVLGHPMKLDSGGTWKREHLQESIIRKHCFYLWITQQNT